MAGISLSAEQHELLLRSAVARGFTTPNRGPRIGGLLRALLEHAWPWFERQELDPSRCDISPEHAWMLAEMLICRGRDPARWATVMATVGAALGVEMPPAVAAAVKPLLPAAARPDAVKPEPSAAGRRRR
ncbi:MAG: hypothetical protein ACRD1M_06840 [Terriglobales bacterium]